MTGSSKTSFLCSWDKSAEILEAEGRPRERESAFKERDVPLSPNYALAVHTC